MNTQEDLLDQILRRGQVPHHALQVTQERPRPAPEERVEGGGVAPAERQHEPNVLVERVHLRLRRRIKPLRRA